LHFRDQAQRELFLSALRVAMDQQESQFQQIEGFGSTASLDAQAWEALPAIRRSSKGRETSDPAECRCDAVLTRVVFGHHAAEGGHADDNQADWPASEPPRLPCRLCVV
jgi:hypothetical protein